MENHYVYWMYQLQTEVLQQRVTRLNTILDKQRKNVMLPYYFINALWQALDSVNIEKGIQKSIMFANKLNI